MKKKQRKVIFQNDTSGSYKSCQSFVIHESTFGASVKKTLHRRGHHPSLFCGLVIPNTSLNREPYTVLTLLHLTLDDLRSAIICDHVASHR